MSKRVMTYHESVDNVSYFSNQVGVTINGESLSKDRLLIIDDNPQIIEMLSELLQDDFSVIACTNAEESISLAANNNVDLILLDVEMPRLSGFQVCSALKSYTETSQIPIIFLTGVNVPDAEIRGLELGAVDYIYKPCNLAALRMRIANQISLSKQRKSLEVLSNTDGLTRLANRRSLDVSLEREWLGALRSDKPLSVLLIDVDNFKGFNSLYGHLEGDRCLKRVANALLCDLYRKTDFVGRYGGEEFLVGLPYTSEKGAVQIAKHLLNNVIDLNHEHKGNPPNNIVTVSIGLVTLTANSPAKQQDGLFFFLDEVDKQLFRAKAQGKNRACYASI